MGFDKRRRSRQEVCLYFLTGELPIAARLHLDLLSLFHTIMSNPQTKIFTIVRYILMMSDDKSTTWSQHLRLLCRQYQLPDPLKLIQSSSLMSKSEWKTLTTTRVTVFHEKELREKAVRNNNLQYLNVQLQGLSGRPHASLQYISETRDAMKFRAHMKLLTGDFLSYELLANQRGSDPRCRLCPSPLESTQHILTECLATSELRERLLPDLLNLLHDIQPSNGLLEISRSNRILTQFILDPTSPNLSNDYRIPVQHPSLNDLFRVSRDWCFAITSSRAKQLKNLNAR